MTQIEERSHWSVSKTYWAKINLPEYTGISVFKEYRKYRDNNESPVPFLIEMNERFPDAPDILWWLGIVWKSLNETVEYRNILIKLTSMYPDIKLYSRAFEEYTTYLAYINMPACKETEDWYNAKMDEIWNYTNND